MHGFSRAHPHTLTSANFNNLMIQYKEYFMVYSYCYLEHLGSLRLRHAK
jgi:hypothetical protein